MIVFENGERVIDCVVVEPIGQGGMGAVYKVFDPELNVHRALKVMALPHGTKPPAVAHYEKRFQQEARNLAQLRHPGVVTIHKYGGLDRPGSPRYLLMEFLQGRTLREWFAEDHPSLDRVLSVAKQLASALKAIHGHGILHRDIKLTNVMVVQAHGTDEENVVVIDFGLAKTDEDERLTKTGAVAGTTQNLAPEIVAAAFDSNGMKPIAHTVLTDIWAMGCVLYSLCTHRSVWKTKSDITIHEEIRRAALTPVEDYRSDISQEFAAVIMRLLAVDPVSRYQSAAEVLDALDGVTTTTDETKPPFVPPQPPVNPSKPTATALVPSEVATSGLLTAPGMPALGRIADQETVSSRPQQERLDSGSFSLELPPKASPAGAPLFPASFADGSGAPSASVNSAHDAMRPDQVGAVKVPPAVPPSTESGAGTSGDASLWSAALGGGNDASRVSGAEHREPPVATGASLEGASEPTPLVPAHVERETAAPAFVPDAAQTPATMPARALLIPVVVGLLVASGVGALMVWGESAVKTARPNSGFVDPSTIHKAKAEREMRALQKETDRKTSLVTLTPTAARTSDVRSKRKPRETEPSALPKTQAAPGRRSGRRASKPKPKTSVTPSVDYSGYGRRVHRGAVTGNATVDEVKTTAASTSTSSVAGLRLPVRLKGTIVSNPRGPVIAVLTKTTKFGDRKLPKGTELHGTTKGAAGGLIAVDFHVALVGGESVKFRGKAISPDGRTGIPATRITGGASDIAAAATEAALRNVGEGAAKVVGDNPLGAAIRGGTSPAAAKGRKLDHASDGYKTRRNARFFVYVVGT